MLLVPKPFSVYGHGTGDIRTPGEQRTGSRLVDWSGQLLRGALIYGLN